MTELILQNENIIIIVIDLIIYSNVILPSKKTISN